MQKLRRLVAPAAIALAVGTASACTSDSAEPLSPASTPSHDNGGTSGSGNKSDSTFIRNGATAPQDSVAGK